MSSPSLEWRSNVLWKNNEPRAYVWLPYNSMSWEVWVDDRLYLLAGSEAEARRLCEEYVAVSEQYKHAVIKLDPARPRGYYRDAKSNGYKVTKTKI